MTRQELNETMQKLDNILGELNSYMRSLQTLRNGFMQALEHHVKEAQEYFSRKEIELQEDEKLNSKEE
jgi:cell division protein ZapA (FtsZ GTPase activity inhibitor)